MAISFMILAMSGVLAAVNWGGLNSFRLNLNLRLLDVIITLVRRSRPGRLTDALASRIGLYSRGISVGVPE